MSLCYFINTIGNSARSSQPFLSFGMVDIGNIASFVPLYLSFLAISRLFKALSTQNGI